MALQLTPEQEHRIKAVVDAGAYRTVQDALEAALEAMEMAAVPGFDGTARELEGLLLEGLDSGDAIEIDDAFWQSLTTETDILAAQYEARKPGR